MRLCVKKQQCVSGRLVYDKGDSKPLTIRAVELLRRAVRMRACRSTCRRDADQEVGGYRETNSEGSAIARFCELYLRWRRKLAVLRQQHRAGENCFRVCW